jgi:transposase
MVGQMPTREFSKPTFGENRRTDDRLEAACHRGLTIGARSYGSIASILKTGLDRAFRDTAAPDVAPLLHPNIRGRSYYH